MAHTIGEGTPDFVEVPDPGVVGQVRRPAPGTTILLRDAQTLAPLPPVSTDNYGYLNPFDAGAPLVQFSTDGGTTWRGPLQSKESVLAVVTAGTNSAAALITATDAKTKAEQALAAVGTGLLKANGSNACTVPNKLANWARVDILVDPVNTTSSLWPDRFAFYHDTDPAVPGSGTRTGYFNEYGELRARSAKASTQAFRCAGFQGGSSGNIFEVTRFAQAQAIFTVSETAVVSVVPVTAPNVSPNKHTVSSTAPTTPAVDDIWVDKSGATLVLKIWTGTVWRT